MKQFQNYMIKKSTNNPITVYDTIKPLNYLYNIYGLFPIKIESNRFQKSYIQKLYTLIIYLILIYISLTEFIKIEHTIMNTNIVQKVAYLNMTTILIVPALTYINILIKSKKLINFYNLINEVDCILNEQFSIIQQINYKKSFKYNLIQLIIFIIVTLISTRSNCFVFHKQMNIWICIWIICIWPISINLINTIQFCNCNYLILMEFNIINEQIKQQSIIINNENILIKINFITILYNKLYLAQQLINQYFNIQLLLNITAAFLSLTIQIYFFIRIFQNNDDNHEFRTLYAIISCTFWTLLQVFMIILIVYSCSTITEQVNYF